MATVSGHHLIELTRMRADIQDDGNHITDTEILYYVNQAMDDLYEMQLRSERGGVYCKNAPELVKSGRFKYDLPGDFHVLKSVHYFHANNYWPYMEFNFTDYPVWAAAAARGEIDVQCGRYTIRKDQFEQTWELHVFPDGLDDCNLAVVYAPKSFQFSHPDNSWDDINGNSEYLIVSSAIKCLTKRKRDTSALQAELVKQEKKVKNQASFVDSAYPDVMDLAPAGLGRYPVGW